MSSILFKAAGQEQYSTGNWYNLKKSIEYTMYIIEMSYTLYYSSKEKNL